MMVIRAPADDSTTGGGGTDADTLDGFDSVVLFRL